MQINGFSRIGPKPETESYTHTHAHIPINGHIVCQNPNQNRNFGQNSDLCCLWNIFIWGKKVRCFR